MSEINFKPWTKATANLPWGVQRVFLETLKGVADEQVTLAYGRDYTDGGNPCLVNAVGAMLTAGGGKGIPGRYFGDMVTAFDSINRDMYRRGINTDETVSPIAAEILIRNFGELKEQPVADAVDEATKNEAFANNIYVEPSDADLTRDWLNSLSDKAVCESDLVTDPEKINEIEEFLASSDS